MNKKQMDSKTANKNFSKKVAPLVMSTSFIAASFLAAGAPISAAELDAKDVNREVIEHIKITGRKCLNLQRACQVLTKKGSLSAKLPSKNRNDR